MTSSTTWTWWEWLDTVEATAHQDHTTGRPALAAIHAIATMRARAADFTTGASCWPSRSHLAQRAGLKRATVTDVDRWLVEAGLMELIRKRPGNVDEYHLTTPVDPTGAQPTPVDNPPLDPPGAQPRLTPEGTNHQPVDPPVDPLLDPLGDQYLGTSHQTHSSSRGEPPQRDRPPDDDDRIRNVADELGRRDHQRALDDGVPIRNPSAHQAECIARRLHSIELTALARAQPAATVEQLVDVLDHAGQARAPAPPPATRPGASPNDWEITTTDRGAPAAAPRKTA